MKTWSRQSEAAGDISRNGYKEIVVQNMKYN
jgi:hypothetical protein